MKVLAGLAAFWPLVAGAALNITYYQNVPLAPTPLPPSHADSDGETIIRLFQNLGRSTVWKSIANITIEGDTFEPEAWSAWATTASSSVAASFGHLIVFNGKGQRLADATITKRGDIEYHNGGIDFDGKAIWGTIAQYRPNTTAYAYKADPKTLKPTTVVHYNDHLGGIVHDTKEETISCLNWGSRNASTWALRDVKPGCNSPSSSTKPKRVVRNPSYFVDYQDCKWLGHSKFYNGKSVMLCSGVATIGSYNLGGVALVDVATMEPLAEVPIALESALGVRLTQNPVDVSVHDGKLRFYWMPDQRNSTLYVYEAQPDSPFQYGGDPR